MVLKFITLNDNNVKGYATIMEDPNNYHAVAYLADWCGHCQNFKPHWENIIRQLKNNESNYDGYVTTACDKTMNKLPCDIKPSGFPTISLYKGKKHLEDFDKERTEENVLEFIKKLKQSPSIKDTSEHTTKQTVSVTKSKKGKKKSKKSKNTTKKGGSKRKRTRTTTNKNKITRRKKPKNSIRRKTKTKR
tara:strand:- start:2695 stop:3264 length:570 start_codon:yes stop_codon:yes gene_type:complete